MIRRLKDRKIPVIAKRCFRANENVPQPPIDLFPGTNGSTEKRSKSFHHRTLGAVITVK